MSFEAAISALLREGSDDWVPEVGVVWISKSIENAMTPDDQRRVSLSLVREVAKRGLMVIGDLTGPGGSFRKLDGELDELLDDIDRRWQGLGRAPMVGDLFWLQLSRDRTM